MDLLLAEVEFISWFSQELCAKGGAGEGDGASSWQGMGCVDKNMGEAAEGSS